MANTIQKESKIIYLQIGQNYENLGVQKQFDVSEWTAEFPDAHIYLLFKRPGEEAAAPVNTILDEDGILTWTVSNWETGIIGIGFAEIRAIDSSTGLVKKSHVIPCSIEASVTDEDAAPDYPSWVDRMLQFGENVDSIYATLPQELEEGIASIQQEAQTQTEAIEQKGITTRASIPADYTTLSDDVTDLKSAVNDIVPLPIDSWIPYYWIQCPSSAAIGDEISLTPVSNANMAYMIIDVVAGDTFIATGRATSGYVGWFQVDTDNKCVQLGSTIYANTTIVISEPGKLVLNANRNNAYSAYKGINKVEENRDLINSLQSTVEKTTVDDESVLFRLYRKEYEIVKTNTAISLAGKVVGDTLDLTPITAAKFGYLIIPCTADETFILTANAGSGNHPWACLDVNNVILSIANGATVAKATILTPTNTAKLVIRANCDSTVLVIRGKGIVNNLNGEEQILSLSVAAGYWSTNGSGGSTTSYRRTMESIYFRAGTTFKINASADGTATSGALITEWSADGVFIQTLIADSDSSVQTVYMLDHDAYLRFSYRNSYGFSGTVTLPTSSEVMSTVSQVHVAVTDTMYEWERVLNSVCCIGDSLTRGAYYVNGHGGSAIEQNYPYFFAKQTGLTVQNEGMSGSSPSSRWPYFSTFNFTPYNAFFIWWGTNGGLTNTLETDGVIDGQGNLIADYTTYANTNTGDYCKVIGRIISQVPHAKIFLGTIFTTGGDVGTTNAVIAKIAALYPNNVVGVVDNNDGTLYNSASKKLTPSWVHIDNGTHFSMVGNYYLAVHWIKAVRAIIAANPAKFEDIMEDILT